MISEETRGASYFESESDDAETDKIVNESFFVFFYWLKIEERSLDWEISQIWCQLKRDISDKNRELKAQKSFSNYYL